MKQHRSTLYCPDRSFKTGYQQKRARDPLFSPSRRAQLRGARVIGMRVSGIVGIKRRLRKTARAFSELVEGTTRASHTRSSRFFFSADVLILKSPKVLLSEPHGCRVGICNITVVRLRCRPQRASTGQDGGARGWPCQNGSCSVRPVQDDC